MPIVDYKRIADQAEQSLFASPDISEKNKRLLRKFLDIYTVSDARKDIFLRHIKLFLAKTDDVEKAMHNRDEINRIFRSLRDSLSLNYYGTIVNVSNRFVRWLNDGEKPHGFKDIKSISKIKQKRKLNPEDMVTWEDSLKLISVTNSMQLKAIIAVQLDGGLRPSEFTDLNYGDVSVKGNFVIMRVQDGKTGPRNVILWRAVPYTLRWLQNHPSKRKNDPLWVQENNTNGRIKRYSYYAMVERIRKLGRQINLEKPMDFYNLRHSACVIAKLDNIPEEEAAKKFGHSLQFYAETYGRMTAEDSIERLRKVYGIEQEQKKTEKTILCQRCDFVNEPEAELCEKCGAPLSAKKALEIKNENDNLKEELSGLKEQMNKINSFMNQLVEKNPEVVNILASKAVKNKGKMF